MLLVVTPGLVLAAWDSTASVLNGPMCPVWVAYVMSLPVDFLVGFQLLLVELKGDD